MSTTSLTGRAAARNALTDVTRMQTRLRRLFEDPFSLPLFAEPVAWAPSVDVAEDAHAVTVTAELPGMRKEEIELELANGVLTLRGEKVEETERDEQEMHVMERSFGAFRRSFALPWPVDESKVTAEFKDGVLRVTLPRNGERSAHRIAVAG